MRGHFSGSFGRAAVNRGQVPGEHCRRTPYRPCLGAFPAERALPASVFGPRAVGRRRRDWPGSRAAEARCDAGGLSLAMAGFSVEARRPGEVAARRSG